MFELFNPVRYQNHSEAVLDVEKIWSLGQDYLLTGPNDTGLPLTLDVAAERLAWTYGVAKEKVTISITN